MNDNDETQRQTLFAACNAAGTMLDNVSDAEGNPIVFALVAWPEHKPDRAVLMSGSKPSQLDEHRDDMIAALEEALRDARGTFAKVLRPI
jgi:hypothetical protein